MLLQCQSQTLYQLHLLSRQDIHMRSTLLPATQSTSKHVILLRHVLLAYHQRPKWHMLQTSPEAHAMPHILLEHVCKGEIMLFCRDVMACILP